MYVGVEVGAVASRVRWGSRRLLEGGVGGLRVTRRRTASLTTSDGVRKGVVRGSRCGAGTGWRGDEWEKAARARTRRGTPLFHDSNTRRDATRFVFRGRVNVQIVHVQLFRSSFAAKIESIVIFETPSPRNRFRRLDHLDKTKSLSLATQFSCLHCFSLAFDFSPQVVRSSDFAEALPCPSSTKVSPCLRSLIDAQFCGL